MEAKDQVCSIDQAYELRALGVPQRAIFFFKAKDADKKDPKPHISVKRGYFTDRRKYAAFSSAELGNMIPSRYAQLVWKLKNEWIVSSSKITETSNHPTEAQARAHLLILLLQSGVTIHEITKYSKS